MIYLIVLFIIAGIIAGYLTNLYAVRWLFCPIKRKGRLPAWDISIAATKEKKNRLVESLANCVTNSILTSEVLKEGIPDSVIKKHLRQLIDDILEQKRLETIRLSQFSGWEEVKQKVDSHIEALITNDLAPICMELLKQTDFSQLLTKEQANIAAQNIYEIVINQENENCASIMKDFCEKNSELTVEKLIGTKCWERLEEMLFSVWLKTQLLKVFQNGEKLEDGCNYIFQTMQIKEQLDPLQSKIGEKKIGELIQQYALDQVAAYFWTELGAYWKTTEGRRVLQYRKKEWMDFFLAMDIPLKTMLNEETWKQMEGWLRENIPEIIPPLAEFIQKNEAELDEVIRRSIHIAVQKQNKSEYLSWLEESIQVWIVSQINLSKRLQRILQTIKERDSDAAVEQILDFLKEQRICDIVQNILENYPDLWKSFWRESKWKEEAKEILYEFMKDKPVSWLWNRFSLSEFICEKGKQKLLRYVQNNPEKTAQWLVDRLRPLAKEWSKFALGSMEAEQIEQISDFLFGKGQDWFKQEKETVIPKMEQWILEQGREWLATYPSKHADAVTDELKTYLLQQWHHFHIEERSIQQWTAVLNQEERKELLVTRATKQLREKMDHALQGQIHHLVTDALNKVEPEQLCSQIEKLMGGQLKYLSYFGGFLGFLISAAIGYWAVPGLSLYGSPTSWSGLLFGTMAMGVIGVITNIVAIKMLFYPKRQIKWLAKSKWFHLLSEGVILQNQEAFASAMANYVSSELISEQAVRQLYEAKKADFPDRFTQWVEQEGMEWLKQNREKLAQEAINGIISHGKDALDQIKLWLEKQTIHSIITPKTIHSIIKVSDIQNYAAGQFMKWRDTHGEKPLSDCVSMEQIQNIAAEFIEKGEIRLFSYIKEVSLEEIAAQKEEVYQTYISKEWSLEQKKAAHRWLKQRWARTNTGKLKEKTLIWMIRKCNALQQEERIIGEIPVFGQPMEQWGNELLNRRIEEAIDWFYLHIIKKKIEQTFGYQESMTVQSEDWWENWQTKFVLFGMRKMVEPIFREAIWELKEVQLPLYLKSKKQEIHMIAHQFLKEKLYSITAQQAVILVLGEDYPAALNRILFGTIWKEPNQMSTMLEQIAHMAVSLLFDQPPKAYLHMLKMESLVEIERNMHGTWETLRRNLLKMEREKRNLANELSDWLCDGLKKTDVSEITAYLDDETAEHSIKTLLSQENLDLVVDSVISPIFQQYRFGQLISVEELADSVKAMADNFMQTNDWNEQVKTIIAEQIGTLTKYEKLPEAMKKQISCSITELVGDALQKQLGAIMEDLNFYKITEQRLNALTADEMEATIRAFADPIFKTLYALGYLGAVAGVNCYLAILIYAIEKLKTIRDK